MPVGWCGRRSRSAVPLDQPWHAAPKYHSYILECWIGWAHATYICSLSWLCRVCQGYRFDWNPLPIPVSASVMPSSASVNSTVQRHYNVRPRAQAFCFTRPYSPRCKQDTEPFTRAWTRCFSVSYYTSVSLLRLLPAANPICRVAHCPQGSESPDIGNGADSSSRKVVARSCSVSRTSLR